MMKKSILKKSLRNSEPTFSMRVKFSEGTTIIKEGDKGGPLYILLNGKCVVIRHDIPLTSIRKKGIIFGEMSMLLDVPHTATVKAQSDVEVIEIGIALDNKLDHYPKITKSIMHTLENSVVQQTDFLYDYVVEEELVESGELMKEE